MRTKFPSARSNPSPSDLEQLRMVRWMIRIKESPCQGSDIDEAMAQSKRFLRWNVFGKSDEELICRMLRRGLHIQGRCLILSEGYEMWEAFLHDVPI